MPPLSLTGQSALIIHDRRDFYLYELKLQDEVYLGLLDLVADWRTYVEPTLDAVPAPIKSLFGLLSRLPYPEAADRVRQARKLIKQLRDHPKADDLLVLCPICHDALAFLDEATWTLDVMLDCQQCGLSVHPHPSFVVRRTTTSADLAALLTDAPLQTWPAREGEND